MEVFRSIKPKDDFLIKVRKLCNKKKIILIFDECTSGFRENIGGIHLKYKVYRYAFIRKSFRQWLSYYCYFRKKKLQMQKTFISSTFWTERLGYSAALSTLKYMEKHKIQNEINKSGILIKKRGEYLQKIWIKN